MLNVPAVTATAAVAGHLWSCARVGHTRPIAGMSVTASRHARRANVPKRPGSVPCTTPGGIAERERDCLAPLLPG